MTNIAKTLDLEPMDILEGEWLEWTDPSSTWGLLSRHKEETACVVEETANETVRPDGLPFFDEAELQELIAREPFRIPGVTQPAATAREVRVPPMVGSADVVIVEANGTITIVECKLYTNPEGHGAVIGQALSYAAGLHERIDYAAFQKRFEAGDDSLTDPFKGLKDWDEVSFGDAVARKLEAGDFRVAIAADELSEPLQLTLAFLGDRQPKGVELVEYEVYPRAHGEKRPKLGRDALIAEIRRFYGDPAADAADALLGWAIAQGLNVVIERFEAKVATSRATLFRIKRYREVRVSLDGIERQLKRTGDDSVERLAQDLERLDVEREDKKARILLRDLDARAFISVMQRVLGEIAR